MIVTLAVGFAATFAIIVLSASLQKPISVRAAEGLFLLVRASATESADRFTLAEYEAFRRLSSGGSVVAAYSTERVETGPHTPPVRAAFVSDNYFEVVAPSLVLGRMLGAGDRDAVAVVSDRLWQQRFAGSSSAAATMTVAGVIVQIVGVADRRFVGLDTGAPVDLWLPLYLASRIVPLARTEDRSIRWLYVLARSPQGSSDAALAGELQGVIAGFSGSPAPRIGMTALGTGNDRFLKSLGTVLSLVAVAAGIMWILTVTNVSLLLVAKAVRLRRDTAIRLALGGRPLQVLRPFVAEVLLLSLCATLCAVPAIPLVTVVVLSFANANGLPLEVDQRLTFASLWPIAATILLTVLVVVAVPVLQARRKEAVKALSLYLGASADKRDTHILKTLVAVQCGFAVALLTPTLLIDATVRNLTNVELGFAPQGILVVSYRPSARSSHVKDAQGYPSALLQRMRELPGVRSVTTAASVPFGEAVMSVTVAADGNHDGRQIQAGYNVVGPQFCATLGTRILEGRDIASTDDKSVPPVALVTASLARDLWPGSSAIGQRLLIGNEAAYVIGMTSDVTYITARESSAPYVHVSALQHDAQQAELTFVIHTTGEPATLLPAVQRTLQPVDGPGIITGSSVLSETVANWFRPARLLAMYLMWTSGVVIVVSAFGVYSLTSYVVSLRWREFAIRVAVGASVPGLLRSVLRHVMQAAILGVAAGLLLGVSIGRVFRHALYGVTASEPLVLLAGSTLMLAIATLSILVASLRLAAIPLRSVLDTV